MITIESTANLIDTAISSAKSWQHYLLNCRGLFPTIAFAALKDSRNSNAATLLDDLRATSDEVEDISPKSSFLYSTWDFNERTCLTIIDEIKGSNPRILALGCPTLVMQILKHKDAQITLVELSPSRLIQSARVVSVQHDVMLLSGNDFSGAFDYVIFDPPWYMDAYKHWLRLAAHACRVDGKIIFPLFGELTRPTAEPERKYIEELCHEIWLACTMKKQMVRYLLPSFEAAILKRTNLPVISWKAADLMVCTKKGHTNHMTTAVHYNRCPIAQITVRDCAIDIRIDRYEPGALLYAPEDGIEMATPSARELGNADSNIYTSTGLRAISSRPVEFASQAVQMRDCTFTQIVAAAGG